jgi:hypothetical protein
VGIKVNLRDTPDSQNFGPLPIGKYPCRLTIEAYQKDAQGNLMLDGDGQKTFYRSSAGDPQWKFTCTVLDGPYKGRTIKDQLTFSAGGLKRIKVLYVRGGFARGDEESIELEPDDLDGTFWNIEIDKHEPAVKRDGSPSLDKNGKQYVNSRIAFAGFELMDAATAARLAKNGPAPTSGGAPENSDDLPPF